jgi:hypothetical protein
VTCTAGPYTYTGSAQAPCTATVTGVGGLSQSVSVIYSNNTDAGTATASASFGGDADHSGSSDSKTFTIGQAPSTTLVTCPASVGYTGSAQEPCSAAVTGAGALNQALTVSYSNNTNPGTATASANFAGDANHTGSSDSKMFAIGQSTSTTTVTCPAGPYTYTGAAQAPCSATVTGVGGLSQSVSVTYTNNTNAGTATASASFAGDASHTGSSDSKTFTIGQATSTTVVTCPASVASTGSALTPCSAVATGAGSLNQSLTVSYSNNTNPGTATASANFAGDANHTGSSDSKTFTITPPVSTDTQGPISTNTVAQPVPVNTLSLLTSNISDVTKGNSNIQAAYYTVDGLPVGGIAMTAADTFNGPNENVKATLAGFSTIGVHTVCVWGVDAANNIGAQDCAFLAVYDPSAGFVTGGGWINSPAGAMPANPTATGKANFGFNSQYKNGKTVPSGDTQIQFQTGNLNFKSTSYDWMIISGAKATYYGTGTINGSGSYSFILSGIDGKQTGGGGVDKFRIKIYADNQGNGVISTTTSPQGPIAPIRPRLWAEAASRSKELTL